MEYNNFRDHPDIRQLYSLSAGDQWRSVETAEENLQKTRRDETNDQQLTRDMGSASVYYVGRQGTKVKWNPDRETPSAAVARFKSLAQAELNCSEATLDRVCFVLHQGMAHSFTTLAATRVDDLHHILGFRAMMVGPQDAAYDTPATMYRVAKGDRETQPDLRLMQGLRLWEIDENYRHVDSIPRGWIIGEVIYNLEKDSSRIEWTYHPLERRRLSGAETPPVAATRFGNRPTWKERLAARAANLYAYIWAPPPVVQQSATGTIETAGFVTELPDPTSEEGKDLLTGFEKDRKREGQNYFFKPAKGYREEYSSGDFDQWLTRLLPSGCTRATTTIKMAAYQRLSLMVMGKVQAQEEIDFPHRLARDDDGDVMFTIGVNAKGDDLTLTADFAFKLQKFDGVDKFDDIGRVIIRAEIDFAADTLKIRYRKTVGKKK